MLTKVDVMPLLIEACPSYRRRWTEYIAHSYSPGDEQLLYVDLGDFANHMVKQLAADNTGEFTAVFKVVERLHLDGDGFVREAATIGFMEGLQNIAEHRRMDEDRFKEWLGPESLRWWIGLQNFWSGRSPRVQPAD